MIETPSASQAATDETERLLQIQPIEAQLENKTEEPQHVVATSAEQMELSLPLAASSHAGEQSPQTQATETQLEQKIEESQHAIATSAGQIELSWPAAATTDPGDQSPQTQTIEAQPEQRTEEPEQVVAPLPENIEPASPSDMMSDAADPSAQTAPAEAQLEMCAEDGGTDGTLFQTEDLVFVPWRADEPVDVTEPAPETPVLEEQAKAPVPAEVVCNQPEEPHIEHSTPASAQSNQPLALNQPAENPPTPEAPVEKVAQVYPMIPPAPNAPVPRREEFEARLQMPANPQSKESLVEKKPVELVPGLSADSAAPCEPPISEPVEPENASCKIEDAAEEAPPTSAPLPEQLPTADFPNPVEPETAAMTANLESCVEQTVAPEPEMEVAIDLGGYDNKSEKNLEQPPKKKVLVVDDDPTLRMLLKMWLEPHGYECLLAEHGKAAQAVVQANHPAVILVDLLMPVMDGLAFVEWLRGTAKDSTPVLVFTNLDDAKITQQALDSGANAFACKPLRLKELLKTMKELVAA
jgi:CheY-like chemotaxis protein